VNLSRKEFLTRGLLSLREILLPRDPEVRVEHGELVRPPGSVPERIGECGECDLCLKVCPEKVITRPTDVRGPVMNFSNGRCRFCYLCTDACPSGVLTPPLEGEQFRLGIASLTTGCLAPGGCFTCSERCPQEAIQVSWGSGVRIDRELCIGCGNCESSCPVRPAAIQVAPITVQQS
jgi:ferredoxin-type protein NapF